VRIAADKVADYDFIVRALDAAAQAGLARIALETQLKGE
jgi:biopolymer transport protein ExbD